MTKPITIQKWVLFSFGGWVLVWGAAGCAVPQPRGQGLYQYIKEPSKGGWYHFYLPVDYVRNQGVHPHDSRKKWPLVMTFHGMKPYDNARPQEREWEYEADLYGYIVCAPELSSSYSFMQYPLVEEKSYVLNDREKVMAIMDHVFSTTKADPKAVLATSWSCGGYLAHYFVNRFPSRFTCLATRLSNFSSELLIEDTVPAYRDLPVAVFIGDGDFAACKSESEKAVAWYLARNFRLVRGKMIDNMGHRRIPQTAAAFFAEQLGIAPLHPAEAAATVAQVQMTDYHPPQEMIASLAPATVVAKNNPRTVAPSPAPAPAQPAPGPTARSAQPAAPSPSRTVPVYFSMNAGRNYPFGVRPFFQSQPSTADAGMTTPMTPQTQLASAKQPAPARPLAPPPRPSPEGRAPSPPVEIAVDRGPNPLHAPNDAGSRDHRVNPNNTLLTSTDGPNSPSSVRSSGTTPPSNASPAPPPPAKRVTIRLGGPAIGTAPHYLSYSVDLPSDLTRGADFLWMDNGVWMGDEPSGVKILETPGLHRISVVIITPDNREYRGTATVQVLEPGVARGNSAKGR